MKKRQDKGLSLFGGLGILLSLAGLHRRAWLVGAVVGSVGLAMLDTAGVAAMVPLMTLVTGGDATSGFLGWFSRLIGVSEERDLILWIAALVTSLFLLKSIFTIWFRWWLLGYSTRIAASAATEILQKYAASPYADHRRRSMPEIYRNVNDATSQASTVLLGVLGIAADALTIVAVMAVLLFSSPLATLMAVAFFGLLLGGIQAIFKSKQRHTGEVLAESSLVAWRYLMPALDGFREARLTASSRVFVEGFRRARGEMAYSRRVLSIVSEIPRYVLEIGFVIAIGLIAVVLFATSSEATAISVLGLFAAASVRMLPTLNRVSATFAIIRSGEPGLRILRDAAEDINQSASFDESAPAVAPFSGDICLEGVTFCYPDADQPTLEGITLLVRENETTAVVGSSGAGKSTMIDLVLGLLQPTSGSITCGGRPVNESLIDWYDGLSVVPQDVFLINDTLAANVAFGVPEQERDIDRIHAALHQAELDDVVSDLPDGVHTAVGERGVRLSGGQRQRIGLARALYRQPRVLVLDEATSALDNETENQIATMLRTLRGKMTVIVVAHRLSTVRDADKLVFLSGGQVAAEGSFDEVRRHNVEFAHLVELGELK